MSDESRLERSRQWFDAAINDLVAAKMLMDHGLFAHACFLSQQSAEKGMKGFIAIEKNPARSHSLGELLSDLPQDVRLADLEPSRLDRFYIGTRYPESLPEGASIQKSFGKRDALDAISTAEGTVLLLASWARTLGVNIPESQTAPPMPSETMDRELERDFHNGVIPRLEHVSKRGLLGILEMVNQHPVSDNEINVMNNRVKAEGLTPEVRNTIQKLNERGQLDVKERRLTPEQLQKNALALNQLGDTVSKQPDSAEKNTALEHVRKWSQVTIQAIHQRGGVSSGPSM